jgi:hypothetical protein
MAPRTPRPTVSQYEEKLKEQERDLQRLRWDYHRMCRLVIEKVPPVPLAKLLIDYVDKDVRDNIGAIVAAAVELPGPFGPFERRALCPMCRRPVTPRASRFPKASPDTSWGVGTHYVAR